MTEQLCDGSAERGSRSKKNKQEEAKNGGRQHQGQRRDSFEKRKPSASAKHQRGGQGHSDKKKNCGSEGGQPERERECLPVHRLLDRRETAFRQLRLHFGREQIVKKFVRRGAL